MQVSSRKGQVKTRQTPDMEVILTHENADFDAIASLLAASKLFPRAKPVLPRRINRNVRAFLALYGASLPFVQADELPRTPIRHVILVDTLGLVTVRNMAPDVQVDIIDHHEPERPLPDNWRYSGEPLGATTTLLVEALSSRTHSLTHVEATLLLLGIYEDTGSLSYPMTTARDVRAAAWLLDQGASLDVARPFLHHPLAPAQRELYERLLANSTTIEVEGHSIVLAAAEAPEFDEEISILAHQLRDELEPSALFVLVALNGRIQLVARSTTDDIDVAVVARHFGGGGHRRAAAALIRDQTLQAVCETIQQLLSQSVRPAITVAQVMSRGVQVLSPETTIAEAAEHMRRTGHEGFPVVSNGRVVGLLTRRAVDRALQFQMGAKPVAQIMEAGNVTVRASDSVRSLQRLMIESGWGQIPVVEGDRIVGVVTRTDLITLWGASSAHSPQPDVAALLESALSPPLLALVRRIAETAHQMGFVPYFVGGLVRDLLLGCSITDVDMVIEGDAIQLARRLANDFGGRVRAHRQFGTAKWLLPARIWREVAPEHHPRDTTDLPSSIDLVTARTEFYTRPTALPEVASSSIKQDLHRRDFTINTLAIRLDPDHWGELLDFYGGLSDLRNGIVRVLHSLSFVDDPTRMLRAARFESRLRFRMDPRTEELIRNALPLLKNLSGSRIARELSLIFEEAEPERPLSRLEALQVLSHIHPALHFDKWVYEHFRLLRTELDPSVWELTDDDRAFLHWALWMYRRTKEEIDALIARLKLPRAEAEHLRLLPAVRQVLRRLARLQRPSTIVRLLEPFPGRVLATAYLATRSTRTRELLLRYQTVWRHVQPELTGDDLKALGLKPGPLFGELLAALRGARLDGKLSNRAQEEEFVHKLLTARAATKSTGHLELAC